MWLRRDGERISTLDLYERTPVLLCGPEGDDWHEAGLRVAKRSGIPLACYRVGPDEAHELAPEEGADWAGLHDAAADGAVLVRPDGFIAWRAQTAQPTPERVLEEALNSVLRRP
ncbi:MAG TPA: monooxygenase, partial [Streptomyces sp.]